MFFKSHGLFFGPLGKHFQESGAIFWTTRQFFSRIMGYFSDPRQLFHDFLKTKKMRNVCTINLAAVSRRDLYYVSENESFCFGHKFWISRSRAGLDFGGGCEM